MKLKATLIGMLFLGAGPLQPLGADLLDEIARPVAGKARRASSGLFDPESNQDSYHLGPGEREVLTELQGPGEIRRASDLIETYAPDLAADLADLALADAGDVQVPDVSPREALQAAAAELRRRSCPQRWRLGRPHHDGGRRRGGARALPGPSRSSSTPRISGASTSAAVNYARR
jgi:hypothetical protein